MKTAFRILLLFGLLAFPNRVDAGLGSQRHSSSICNSTPACAKCDFAAINHASEHWDKLSKDDLERFLCAFDDSCDWPPDLLETREGQYFGTAWDMLFMYFDQHFDLYMEVLEENKSINTEYLLKLFSEPAVYDLPHDQILEKLRQVENKTVLQKRLTEAFERGIEAR